MTVEKRFYSVHAGKSISENESKDKFGNPKGSKWDLGLRGAFKGYTIIILQFAWERHPSDQFISQYIGPSPVFDMKKPIKALKKKGFKVKRFYKEIPPPGELEELLEKKSQLWIISGHKQNLTKNHLKLIKNYYGEGGSLFLWGDNDPWNVDANLVLEEIFPGSRLSGDFVGEKNLSEVAEGANIGFRKHAITSGIVKLYEGTTISNLNQEHDFDCIMKSSNGMCINAIHDNLFSRCIVDGGFTRLYYKWDKAGTGRFVVNCAAWLANWEANESQSYSIDFSQRMRL